MEALMHISRKTLMAGIAGLALAAGCTAALAGGEAVHAMTVALPGGGTVVIQYAGDAAPQVRFGATPVAADFFGPDSPFAAIERVSAQMDREITDMMRQADAMAMQTANLDRPFEADMRSLPAGVSEYSAVSMMTGNGFCSRSTQITSFGNGQKPKVVTRTSGDCSKPQGAMEQPGEKPDPSLTTIKARQDQTVQHATDRI
jgi:hypothetical protein